MDQRSRHARFRGDQLARRYPAGRTSLLLGSLLSWKSRTLALGVLPPRSSCSSCALPELQGPRPAMAPWLRCSPCHEAELKSSKLPTMVIYAGLGNKVVVFTGIGSRVASQEKELHWSLVLRVQSVAITLRHASPVMAEVQLRCAAPSEWDACRSLCCHGRLASCRRGNSWTGRGGPSFLLG